MIEFKKGGAMKTKIDLKNLEIIGAIFGIVFGTMLHFIYQWSGHAVWTAYFSAVNESVWEHMKLFFFPLLVFTLVEWFWVKEKDKLLFAKMAEAVLGIIFIAAVFYTYTGALGVENVIDDIVTFMVAVVLGKTLSFAVLSSDYKPRLPFAAYIYGAGLVALTLFFFIATFNPPKVPLFRDSETGNYGLQK
jgi:hypothetical protein